VTLQLFNEFEGMFRMNTINYNNKSNRYELTYTCKSCKKTKTVIYRNRQECVAHRGRCLSCWNKINHSEPITFQYLLTGEKRSAKSITEFCNITNLGKNGKFHFAEVRKGIRLHYKGWGLPQKIRLDPSKVQFIMQTLLKKAVIT
jgi:hypothetical protein